MKSIKVNSWLPAFSGFYGTIWETDGQEEMEIENINDMRRAAGLPEVDYDAIEWDYIGYMNEVTRHLVADIGDTLADLGFADKTKFQKISSPREYNFANDSINVEYTLSDKNIARVAAYLVEHQALFANYLKQRYTSYDGFISSYSNDIEDWIMDVRATMSHDHKSGAVFQFILTQEEGEDYEARLYENATGNGAYLTASNYEKLTKAVA